MSYDPRQAYSYRTSPTDQYVLALDKKEVIRGMSAIVWKYIHDNHSYSMAHALKYEGYTLTPVEEWIDP